MGIKCHIKGYEKNYEILGAIALYKFIAFEPGTTIYRENMPSTQQIEKFKAKGLEMMESRPEFIGCSFENLKSAMNFHNIRFDLYYESKIVLSNIENNLQFDIKLLTKSKKDISNLAIVTSHFDLHYIPDGLKISGKTKNNKDAYLTCLGKILGKNLSSNPLADPNINYFEVEKKFEINLEIWSKSHQKNKIDRFRYKRIYKGSKFEKTYKFHYVKTWKKIILITNEQLYFKSFFQCPNSHFKCFYVCNKKYNFDRHVAQCIDPKILRDNPECTQTVYGKNFHPLASLINENIIETEPIMQNFLFYDIESLVSKSPETRGKTEILATHNLLSISATAFLNGCITTKTWVIKDSTPKSELEIVEKFLDFVFWAEDIMEPDKNVFRAIEKIDVLIDYERERLESLGRDKSPRLSEMIKSKRSLEIYLQFNVFGYNASKYDLQILITLIMQTLETREYISPTFNSGIKILKKGTAYFSVQFCNIHFKDLMAFTCPMSLDKYLKTWTATENKMVIFCYIKIHYDPNNLRFIHMKSSKQSRRFEIVQYFLRLKNLIVN